MKKDYRFSPFILGTALALGALPTFADDGIIDIPFSNSAFLCQNMSSGLAQTTCGVSPSGTMAVGNDGNGAVAWDLSGVATTLSGSSTSDDFASAVSATGVIVGFIYQGHADGMIYGSAAFWTSPTSSPTYISVPSSSVISEALGVSENGSYIVGDARISSDRRAFVYDVSGDVATVLPITETSSYAFGVTNDGAVVVGETWNNGDPIATYWLNAGSIYTENYFAVDPSSTNSVANAITPDGTVVVGSTGFSDGTSHATKWTGSKATGYATYVNLDPSGIWRNSYAQAVNRDGSVIVGSMTNYSSHNYGFRWTSPTGMQTIEDWLTAAGVTVNMLNSTISANGVSGDGSVVVGTLDDGEGFIARVSSTGSGIITDDTLLTSLIGNTVVPYAASFSGDLVLHGAHGHPLQHLAPVGKSSVWMNGDFGFVSSHDANAYNDVAEIGVGRRVSKFLQLNFSAGKIFSNQKTVYEGHNNQNFTFVLPEVIANIPDTSIWTTFSFLYAGGETDVKRGYINAGNDDFSTGAPRVDLYGVRVRADWKNALTVAGAGLTPYIDQQHIETAVTSYTETGGGFPAEWNGRHEHDDVTRVGINVEKALTSMTKVYFGIEQNFWWQGHEASASGEVLGLSTFNLPGAHFTRNWTHFSLGASRSLGNGQVISAFLNANTTDHNPQFWLNVGYQYNF